MAALSPWHCEYCGQHFPVPCLARDHELMHLEDDDDG